MYLGLERKEIAPGTPSSILAKVWTETLSGKFHGLLLLSLLIVQISQKKTNYATFSAKKLREGLFFECLMVSFGQKNWHEEKAVRERKSVPPGLGTCAERFS